MQPWLWISLAVLAGLLEIFVADLTGFALAFGALLAAGTAAAGLDWTWQLVAASVGILGFIFGLRPLAVRGRRSQTTVLEHDLVGSEGWLVKPIEPGQPGSVKVRGELWLAVSDTPITAETPVVIIAVDGASVSVIAK